MVGDEVIKNHNLIETEAEAVAFVVCKAYGVDTQALSSEYIRLHRGDNKLLMASLDRIQQTATRIIGLIEDDKNTPIYIRTSHRSKVRRHVTHQSISTSIPSLTNRRARFDEEFARRSLNRLPFSERVTVGEIENRTSDACQPSSLRIPQRLYRYL